MELTRFTSAELFYRKVERFLLDSEAKHNLILGLCTDLMRNLNLYGDQPYMAAVADGGQVTAAALMTPPYNLTLSQVALPGALEAIAADLSGVHPVLPGVSGPGDTALRFAGIWRRRSGQLFHLNRAMRVYQLTAVRPVRGVVGVPRPATAADRDLVTTWFAAFEREALGEEQPDPAAVERAVDRWLATGTRWLYLWDDGGPVSMAGVSGPTPHGIRIGPVYTPPELRERGYASALVAAVSQLQLDSGRAFCFLFTDLANPTSNHIYQQIGYEAVCDVSEYRFEPAGGTET